MGPVYRLMELLHSPTRPLFLTRCITVHALRSDSLLCCATHWRSPLQEHTAPSLSLSSLSLDLPLALCLRCRRRVPTAAVVMCLSIVNAVRPLSLKRSTRHRPCTSIQPCPMAARARLQLRLRHSKHKRGRHSSPQLLLLIIPQTKQHAGHSSSTCRDSISNSSNSNRRNLSICIRRRHSHRSMLTRRLQLLAILPLLSRCLRRLSPSIPCACSNGCSTRTLPVE